MKAASKHILFKKSIPFLILAALLSLTVLIWNYYIRNKIEKENQRFYETCSNHLNPLNERFKNYWMLLQGAASVITAQEQLTQQEWKLYFDYQNIKQLFPEIERLEFAVKTNYSYPENIEPFNTPYSFNEAPIYPVSSSKSIYYPIRFLEPHSEHNDQFLGYDISSNPYYLKAINHCILSGTASMSNTFYQQDNIDSIPVFVIVTSLYKNGIIPNDQKKRKSTIKGVVSLVVDIEKMLNSLIMETNPNINIRIFDGNSTSPDSLIFKNTDSQGTSSGQFIFKPFRDTRKIELYHHQWTVQFESNRIFFSKYDRFSSLIVLICGVLLSILSFLLIKKTLHKKEETERLYHTLIEQSGDAFFLFDQQGRILEINNQACNFLGYKKNELLKLSINDIEPQLKLDDIKSEWKKLSSGNSFIRNSNFLQKNGQLIPVETHFGFLEWEGKILIPALSRDISERIHQKNELIESRRMLHNVIDTIPIRVYWKNIHGEYLGCNSLFAKDAGFANAKDVIGLNNNDLSWAPIAQKFIDIDKNIIETGQSILNYEEQKNLPGNKPTWFRTSKSPLRSSDGTIVGILGIYEDITEQKHHLEEIRLSNERLLTVMNSINSIIYIADIETHEILFINDTLKKSRGDDLIGKKCWEALLNYNQPCPFCTNDKLLTADKKPTGIIQWEYQNPVDNRWYDIRDCAIQWVDGRMVRMEIATDIHERKMTEEMLRQSEEKYRLFFEKAPLGIFHFDNEGTITQCNKNLTRIFNARYDQIIGMNLLRLSDKEMADSIANVLKGQFVNYENLFIWHVSGKSTPIKAWHTPLFNSKKEVTGGITFIEDRTSHFEMEAYKKQAEIARESARFKQSFLANMSHEIRTPLTGVLGMAEILSKTKLDEKQIEYVNTLTESGENLRNIINLILDFSKLEAGQMSLKPSSFDFRQFIDNTKNLYAVLASKKNLQLIFISDPNIPSQIFADKPKLTQILSNLLSNAIKFTNTGEITLQSYFVHDQQYSDNVDFSIRIEVRDTGVGIKKEYLDKLFKPFFQIDDEQIRNNLGTGLGLSICKQLAELMGGTTGVDSVEGKGSSFWFTFNAKHAHTDSSDSSTTIQKTSLSEHKSLNILVVEDNTINRKVIEIMLSFLGHNVSFAHNGQMALDIFKPNTFDIILMDIEMPVLDGVSATRILKEKYTSLPPIVGLSANALEGDREKYINLGMDEYLTKPLSEDDFNLLIKRLFDKNNS